MPCGGGLAVYFSYKISRPIQRIYSSIGDKTGEEPKSLQNVSQRFSFFLSNYQEAKEEERSLRTSFVEMAVLRLLSGHDTHIQDLTRQLERECAFTDPVYQLCVVEVTFSQEQEAFRDTERINMQLNFRGDLAERDVTLPAHSLYRGLRADVELPGGIVAKRKLLNEFYHELTDMQGIGSESNLTASIVAYVEKHYSSDLYLERITQELGLSVKYISKVFKEKTGRNLSDYINEVRIQHVKEMLMQTDMSIASISEAAGIYSRSTLIRLFRKYEGVTPQRIPGTGARPEELNAYIQAGNALKREDGYIRYAGDESPNLVFHDGGLRPAVGTWNVQVVRANRAHPECAEGVGNTYNHAPNITWWQGKFYLAYLSNPVHEHLGAGQTFLRTSLDALHWSKPQVLFPPYPLDLSLDNGPHADLFEEGEAYACMHQRMNFYIAKDGRLLALGFYGLSPEVFTMPCVGNGIGRAVREIYADGSFGPIYMALYSTRCGYNRETCRFPYYQDSPDAGFVAAVDELLADKLTVLQWWEENRDYPAEDFFAIRGGGEAFNYYQLPDGRLVGLWKKSRVSISEDGGKTWAPVKISPSLVMSGGKIWGERTPDGRYALCYNPNTDSCHRWPLAVVTSEDGIVFRDMLCVHGEVPPQRYWGFWRDCGPNYIRGLEAGAVAPDGAMYLTYSVNKEDIWVSRVPAPITGRVT